MWHYLNPAEWALTGLTVVAILAPQWIGWLGRTWSKAQSDGAECSEG